MTTYVSLAIKEYAEGRVCIVTDRISGYLTNHGQSSPAFWRNVIEWTGRRFPSESISIGIIETFKVPSTNLDFISPVSYKNIDLQYLANNDFGEFNLLYFIGLPSLVSDEVAEKIEEYVKVGGGVLIEVPDRGGEYINILKYIDNIYCISPERPSYDYASWTVNGRQSYVYDPHAKIGLYSSLSLASFPSSWEIIMTDAPVLQEYIPTKEIVADGKCESLVGISYASSFTKGIVIMEEGLNSSSSSSSADSSSSSSSSSFEDPDYWNVCNNIIAQWKMNDNINTPIVCNSQGNFALTGLFKRNNVNRNTNLQHVSGITDGALEFNGIDDNIYVASGQDLNFRNATTDKPCSMSMWVYIKDNYSSYDDSYLLEKKNVWYFEIKNGGLVVYFYGVSTGYISATTENNILPKNRWTNLMFTFDGGIDLKIYVDGSDVTFDVAKILYTAKKNSITPFYIGSNSSSGFFEGYIDNIIMVDKKLSNIEVEGLYNIGRGTEECEGTVIYTSSSSSISSSSSSIDSSSSSYSSSSSSIDSSSSNE